MFNARSGQLSTAIFYVNVQLPIDEVTQVLSQPEAYPDTTRSVSRVETHISRVFLTDRYAYKLKKPVRFEFLDYSSPELRRGACQAELELNRRMSRGVYLSLAAVVRGTDGRLQVVDMTSGVRPANSEAARGGEFHEARPLATRFAPTGNHAPGGEVVEWLVKMRRLPDDRSLEMLIRQGKLQPTHVTELGRFLAEYYTQLPPVTLEPRVYLTRLRRHITENLRELLRPHRELDFDLIRRTQHHQLWYLHLEETAFANRVRDGRIVDGHGDLRPEHIYWAPELEIIDCLEFSSELRQVDALDELSFLAMECSRLGRAEIGEQVLRAYATACNDRPPFAIWNFYQAYRASVRAKVAAIRSDQDAQAERRDETLRSITAYLQIALDRCQNFRVPRLIVVSGLMGTGKSTVATDLAQRLSAGLLQTDAIRRELFGVVDDQAHFQAGRYTADRRQRVYDELFSRAATQLSDGKDVILDGTFLADAHLLQAWQLAERHHARLVHLRCSCPDEVALQRIEGRMRDVNRISDARPELYFQQKELAARMEAEPFGEGAAETGVARPTLLEKADTQDGHPGRCEVQGGGDDSFSHSSSRRLVDQPTGDGSTAGLPTTGRLVRRWTIDTTGTPQAITAQVSQILEMPPP